MSPPGSDAHEVPITLPDLGAGSQPVRLVQWLVDVGMHVEEGDRVAEVLTGGVLFHVPAPASGNLVMVVRGDGARIEVGDMLGVIRSAGS